MLTVQHCHCAHPTPRRILVLTPWFPDHPNDGKHPHLLHQVSALSALGLEITVLVIRSSLPKIFRRRRDMTDRIDRVAYGRFGFDILEKSYLVIPRNYFYEYYHLLMKRTLQRAFARITQARRYDVAHIHTEYAAHGLSALARANGLPVVLTLHGSITSTKPYDSPKKVARVINTLNKADRVILVGKVLADFYRGLGCRADNFVVIPNGYHVPSELGPRCDRLTEGSPVKFCSVSHLDDAKGVMLNLHTLHRLQDEGFTRWEYHVVGKGPLRQNMEDFVRQHRLNAKVFFYGQLDHPEAMTIMNRCDVFVLPSKNEAFGVVYLEAMGLGLLSVGLSGAGPSDFIHHMQDGLLVNPDSEDWYSTIKAVVSEPAVFRKMAENGCKKVNENYSWIHNAKKVAKVYTDALCQKVTVTR